MYADLLLTVMAEDGSSTLYTVRYVRPVTPSGNSEYDNFSTTYSRSLGWTDPYRYTENGNKRFPFGSTLWVGKTLSQGDFYQTFVTYGVSEGYYKFKTNYVNGMFFTGEFTVTKAMAEQTSVALRVKLKARGTPQQAGTFNYTLFESGDNFTITVLNASDSAVAIENNRIPLPATGTLLNELTFNATQTTEKFRYENAWSGTGFNMVGSQRGVPEITKVVEDPSQAGNYVLQMYSYDRDAQWRADNNIIVGGGGNAIYDGDDGDTQDDIWYYGNKTFNAENELNTYGQMYLPPSLYWNGFRTATNAKNLSTSTYEKRYFGIFVTSRGLMVRGVGDCYYSFLQRGITDKSGWWTFGISTKKTTHEMFFFAKQGKSNAFTSDDLIGRLSDWSTPFSYEGVLSDGPLIYISMDNPFTTTFSTEESIFLDNVRMFKGIN